jgi:hypothetical protein
MVQNGPKTVNKMVREWSMNGQRMVQKLGADQGCEPSLGAPVLGLGRATRMGTRMMTRMLTRMSSGSPMLQQVYITCEVSPPPSPPRPLPPSIPPNFHPFLPPSLSLSLTPCFLASLPPLGEGPRSHLTRREGGGGACTWGWWSVLPAEPFELPPVVTRICVPLSRTQFRSITLALALSLAHALSLALARSAAVRCERETHAHRGRAGRRAGGYRCVCARACVRVRACVRGGLEGGKAGGEGSYPSHIQGKGDECTATSDK